MPLFGFPSLLLFLSTPFFVAYRLRRFRDVGREGIISFLRAYAYAILVFFYGGILMAVAEYLYFAYWDHGYLMGAVQELFQSDDGIRIIKEAGLGDVVEESMSGLMSMRPIDYALNQLSLTICAGIVLGIPIGFLMQSKKRKEQQ